MAEGSAATAAAASAPGLRAGEEAAGHLAAAAAATLRSGSASRDFRAGLGPPRLAPIRPLALSLLPLCQSICPFATATPPTHPGSSRIGRAAAAAAAAAASRVAPALRGATAAKSAAPGPGHTRERGVAAAAAASGADWEPVVDHRHLRHPVLLLSDKTSTLGPIHFCLYTSGILGPAGGNATHCTGQDLRYHLTRTGSGDNGPLCRVSMLAGEHSTPQHGL
ncbi:Holliday junction resolvase MOC1, chloroplastic-like [Eumetopias jubatus]|uniref:Holliday junction resolvase MOC1, chloroplastic-like n=1 Tax=Eumetopias jubatus TaxID=34886 RepID=UPI001016C5D0|nr:Holliday junction resolvase MOC1, chloroplastic-like [Eumetopias jubatus]